MTSTYLPTEGRNIALLAETGTTSGWGEIMLGMIAEDGVTEWHFAVEPVARQWSLYRASTTGSDLFYWVESRPLPASVGPGVEQVEVQVLDGEPVLYVNGVNPESLSGAGDSFSVDFEAISLSEIAE